MNDSRESMQECVREEFEQWKQKYIIPDHLKFQVLTLLELQHEFKATSNDHTKRKMDLLKMIQDIEGRLPRDFYKKNAKLNGENKQKILIYCRSELHSFQTHKLICEIAGLDIDIVNRDKLPIETEKHIITICHNKDQLRGKRATIAWNLTTDKEVDDILRDIQSRTIESMNRGVVVTNEEGKMMAIKAEDINFEQ